MATAGDSHRSCPTCSRTYDLDARVCPDDGDTLLLVTDTVDGLIGHSIDGRFTVSALLGKGGFGAVYRAIQHPVEREVAIKVLHKGTDAAAAKRFFAEARSVSRLRNPHTITLFDFGQASDGLIYMAMELASGGSLGALLKREGPLTQRRAVAIACQICESLAEAHAAGVVHRDLKPDNVMIEQRPGEPDFVKVLDFGIAKLRDPTNAASVTDTGVIQGTPTYMSPEQAMGDTVGPQSDLYALGVMLFEMLTGRVPFLGDVPMAILLGHVGTPAPTVADVGTRHEVHPDLVALVARLLSKRPEDRPEDARRLQSLLMAAPSPRGGSRTHARGARSSEGEAQATQLGRAHGAPRDTTTSQPPAVRAHSHRRNAFAAIAAMAVALVAAIVWWQSGGAPVSETPAPPPLAVPSNPTPTGPSEAAGIARPTAPAIAAPVGRVLHVAETEVQSSRRSIALAVAAPPAITLSISSEPTGAAIWLDDQPIGTAPFDYAIPRGPGTVQLVAKLAGHKDYTNRVPIATSLPVHAKLEPLPTPRKKAAAPQGPTLMAPGQR